MDGQPVQSDLVLKYSVQTLRQRDVEKFIGILAKSKLGDAAAHFNGKVVRAAVEAGWIEAPTFTADAVGDMEPWRVAQYARQIDSLYRESMAVPKA